ncbi:13806_t:CDS:2, partial [Entrophospora sp. SA101]
MKKIIKSVPKKKKDNLATPNDELRKTVLFNEAGEQKVEVNQRHLIDKVLA